ncbi:superoxide dismutase [Desulfofustis glycolicus]|uniref:Superoxide dismutase n=1 Tax=Desulfofustis glycolicus DSM 9705 TaxID=1121409 RepID=A0A1M5XZJ2_9BACT|nr:superoxide dismutase [Desulfofustis glycolicus]MCB2218249.1 superoxide dismutase [Desulfobulbaceae bacterium]SHI05237.1 superoxide dismutase, Fe-Mn family [Desulfofustis glycolicus DSM 9705]
MEHNLPSLPYNYDALEPYIDARTMEIHHTKHHQAYINNLNGALRGHDALQEWEPERLIANLDQVPEAIRTTVRNHGGGHVNHSLFWPLLKKDVAPVGPAVAAIAKTFSSIDGFKKAFSEAAVKLFGSGWTWLALHDGELEIVTTANQDNPLSQGKQPILGIDVWEHAYYLLYQNRRPDYVEAFFNVINWERVNELYLAATR